MSKTSIETLCIDTIRTLAMDAVQAANSGHPGTPMALAPVAYQVWAEHLRYDPDHPHWPNRDRFVLSCGHASMLLYGVLHLAGVKQLDRHGRPTGELAVPLEHIKRFRQLHSRCPGHPEHAETTGVETTTGPLGQGIGNSVGMAIASRWLAARYNRPTYPLFDFNVIALCSDGDLMEGISSEAASLAGHLRLGNLCWIYDDNSITIEGETALAFSEQVASRFEGYGWQVTRVADANDLAALDFALREFPSRDGRPTLVIVKSHIGWGSPNKQDTHAAHGAPLGEEEIKLTKQAYGWDPEQKFVVPMEAVSHFQKRIRQRGEVRHKQWQELIASYRQEFPEPAQELDLLLKGQLPANWDADIPTFAADAKGLATRVSGGKVLNGIAGKIGWFLGGSADLAPSTMTLINASGDVRRNDFAGKNLRFGIREHAMGACVNGLALCGLRPFGATFLVFSDYMRPSIRLAAIMKLPSLFVFTHDSIGVGEDGPTHQPIEHLAALRSIPGLIVIRPGDANEVSETYRAALSIGDAPVAMILSRQNLPTLDRGRFASASLSGKGGYILAETSGKKPNVILIATGSELALAVSAYEQLASDGVPVRLVSMPSWELFERQTAEYREQVLPASIPRRVAVEAGIRQGWDRYILSDGAFVGMASYGASAPMAALYEHFQITPERIIAEVRRLNG